MKSKIITSILFLFIIANFYLLQADLINVNANGGAQFLSIQEAINVASNGDTILVHSGTYYENINFNGKNIVVASLYLTTGNKDYINDTVINGNHNGVVVTFENGETSSAILKGFTITNGYAEYGSGIKCKNASKPVIDHLIISGNTATDDGGGVACYTNSSMTISNCIFNNNIANDNGGGIFLNHSKGLIDNCLFSDNISNGGSSAIDCWSSDPLIINCTLVNNISYSWATIGIWDTSSPNIIDCIVSNNTGSGFVFHSQSQATVEYCNCYENSYGSFSGSVPQGLGTIIQVNANNDPCDEFYNIFIDPKLNDTVNSNYVLLPTSPCIDAGIPDTTGLNLPQYDLDGNLRIVDGNGDGIAIIDMGCYESDGMNYNVFTRVTVGDIVNDDGYSHGSSWIDYDNDNDLDLFVANWNDQDNFLYQNNGDGTFTRITNSVIVNDGGKSHGTTWGDYDNDGNIDVFVGNIADQNNFLYSNNGDGTFTKITEGDIVNDAGKSNNCCWGDYNNDGFIDLFIANSGSQNNCLYCNYGDGSFIKVTDGVVVNDAGQSKGCSWGDFNNDGYSDLFVTNSDNQNNYLYCNNGDGTFTKVTDGPVVNDGGDSRGGGSWGDFDNDGDLDLYVSNRLQDNFLYRNNGDGTFAKITDGDIVNDGGNSRGTSWGDYDNDGYLDLFVSNDGGNNFLYKNNCDGTFTKITDETITNNGGVSVGCVWGDYDNDGDLDIFVSNFWGDNNFLYSNNGNDNNWINIKCVGTLSNKLAIGTKVRVKTTLAGNPVWQMREISSLSGYSSQNSMNAMFGLADNTTIDSLIINWPSGIEQVLTNITPNQFITITEPYSPVGQIHLAIPTEYSLPGDTVLVPINVQFPQDSTFTSAGIIVGGYLGSLEFFELIADSSLVGDAGWMYESNETDTLNTIWMAGSEPISGEDVLIWMKFSVPDTATGFIPITLVDALFDTGVVPVELTSGGINIVALIYGDVDFNGLVQAYDASMILQYLVGYINLDDLQLSVADVSIDSTVSALDATLILQYGVGIIDTLPYQPGASYIANGDITMEDQVYTGDPIDVPIIITNAENIYSFEGMIHFDTECLMLSDVYWSDYLDGFFIWTDVEGGEFKLVGSGALPYEEYGVMATIRFYPKDGFNSYDSTTVFFNNMRWNENDTMHNIATSIITNNYGVNNPQEPDLILHQNSPNPFAYNTKIQYSIPLESVVSLKIYNIRGELIVDLVSEFKDKGSYDVVWDGRDKYGNKAVNGIYFYKFISGDSEIIKRMILLR
ncbi:MAG: FG-GAP-like repeat-containing protein [Candidatus Celaenobacter antarcticus]|nr:FG-GAP-like repeat-containing protein [Candidatus Celaenobacter antarcticus]